MIGLSRTTLHPFTHNNNNNNNNNNAIISGFIDKTRVAAAFAPAAERVFHPLPLPPPVPIR